VVRNQMWCVLLVISLGCGGVSVTPTAESVDVTGDVTNGAKPVSGVKLNLQVTDTGLPAVIDVVDGKFTAKVTPGKYTYYFTPGKSANAFKSIPEKYHAGSLDRQIEIGSGTKLTLSLD
jgi:hypothetical protein